MAYWGRINKDCIVPADRPSEAEHAKLPEGVICQIKVIKPRSQKHHGLLFAALDEAFTQWPEAHDFQPDDREHLRAWLIVKAGYRDILATHVEGDVISANVMADFVEKVIRATKGDDKHGFALAHNGQLYVLTPKSIAWDTLSQSDFNVVSQRISDVLKAEINMTLDEFKAQAGEAA